MCFGRGLAALKWGAVALLILDPTLAAEHWVGATDFLWSLPESLPGASIAVCAGSTLCMSGRLSHCQPATHGGAGDNTGSLRCPGPFEEGKASSTPQLLFPQEMSCLLSVSSMVEFQAWGRLN